MSKISTNNLDTSYPVPGVNNTSQGFRTNFQVIKTALDQAATELSELQSNVVLKSGLSGAPLDNDMEGTMLSNVLTTGFRQQTYNLGSGLSGTAVIDMANANVQHGTIDGDVLLEFASWTPSGTLCELELLLSFSDTTATVEFPSSVVNVSTLVNSSGQTVSLKNGQTKLHFKLYTIDCGTTVYVLPLSNTPKVSHIQTRTPVRIGAQGDLKGAVCVDTNYLYICYADYNGTNNIWSRIAVNNVW